MIIMRVDVTDDISPEVDEVTAELGAGVVRYPKADRIPYEYKIVSCATGAEGKSGDPSSPTPPALMPTQAPRPTQVPLPTQAPLTTQAPTPTKPTPVPTT